MQNSIRRGDVVWCRLDPTVGCEIRKCRPAVVVSSDWHNGKPSNPMLVVVPLTRAPTHRGPRLDEVPIEPGSAGLPERSVTATDQLRAIDRQRVLRRCGQVSAAAMKAIDQCLVRVLALTVSDIVRGRAS
jgi:mRNA interferase MazF